MKAPGFITGERKVMVAAGKSGIEKFDLNPEMPADFGTLKVVSMVPEASVFIDGAAVGKVPVERKLQQGEHPVVVRLDGYKQFEQKVRVEAGQTVTVSATLKPVDLLGEGFRSDLYARVAGFTVRLPPLRERREDLGIILAASLDRLATDRARRARVTPEVARALLAYRFPYNARELRASSARRAPPRSSRAPRTSPSASWSGIASPLRATPPLSAPPRPRPTSTGKAPRSW